MSIILDDPRVEAAPPMKPEGLMLDIETLSTEPNAVVLSVAAVPFRLRKSRPEIGVSQLWVCDLTSQIARGRHVSESTQKFWRDQPEAARAHWAFGTPVSIPTMISGIAGVVGQEDMPVWAHGIVFDIGIIQSLCADFDRKVPWKYRALRDCRTVIEEFREYRTRPKEIGVKLVEHDPSSDCVNQIWGLWEHWPEFEEA